MIEMGKIKPFALVMCDGMVKEKFGLEERLNHVLLERMLVEEIIPMVEKKVSVWWMQGKTWHGRIVHGFCTDNKNCMRSPRSV